MAFIKSFITGINSFIRVSEHFGKLTLVRTIMIHTGSGPTPKMVNFFSKKAKKRHKNYSNVDRNKIK